MSVYDHFLKEDKEQLDAQLFLMHKALLNVVEGARKADFDIADNSLLQFEKSYQVVKSLYTKKVNQKENERIDYMRRNYF